MFFPLGLRLDILILERERKFCCPIEKIIWSQYDLERVRGASQELKYEDFSESFSSDNVRAVSLQHGFASKAECVSCLCN